MRGTRVCTVCLAVALLASACSSTPEKPRLVPPRELSLPTTSPSSPPAMVPADEGKLRAEKVARSIEGRWARIKVWRASLDPSGKVATYAISADYDGSIRDRDAYAEHVRTLSGDLRQASVELLQESARTFPKLRYASVWEDLILQAFWSREQILKLGPASAYRSFDAFHALLVSAHIPPPLLRTEQPDSDEP